MIEGMIEWKREISFLSNGAYFESQANLIAWFEVKYEDQTAVFGSENLIF